MGGIFGVVSKSNCTLDLFFGIDYHSHLGTRRGGMAVYGKDGFHRAIHNIEIPRFGRNLKMIWTSWKAIWASAASQTPTPSPF